MKAVGYQQANATPESGALLDIEIPQPQPDARDLLVAVKAVSVNPVDTKIRKRVSVEPPDYKVLGWDAAGVVVQTGAEVSLFKPGDKVWYAGAINRPGSNAEFQLVDERIVSLKPESLNFAEAAAMPLTTITAWELLFDRLAIPANQSSTGSLLITGAAGGVGSMLIQLAAQLTGLTIIATASREPTVNWVKQLGAHHVINHHQPLGSQLTALKIASVDYIASLTHTDDYFAQYADIITPQGKIALIDDPQNIDIRLLKQKSVSLHWEFMYTRPVFNTSDCIKQHKLLSQTAKLVDRQKLQTTLQQNYGIINAQNLLRAHQFIETGQSVGKVVLEGFY